MQPSNILSQAVTRLMGCPPTRQEGSRMKVPLVACAASVAVMSVVPVEAWPEPQHRERAAAGVTLVIEIRWLDRSPGPDERSLFERAARAWSCRLRAYSLVDREPVVGPLTLTQAGYYLRDGRRVPLTRYVEIDEHMRVDDVEGLLILVDDEWWEPVSTGQPHGWEVDATGAFRPWLGVVRLFHRARGDLGTITHEIGHVLGLGTAPGYHALVQEGPEGRSFFAGPHAVAVHGGPVPLEHEHTAPCPSAMSYRDCAGEAPAELDWAMMRDLGYEVMDEPAGPCPDASPRWAERRYR